MFTRWDQRNEYITIVHNSYVCRSAARGATDACYIFCMPCVVTWCWPRKTMADADNMQETIATTCCHCFLITRSMYARAQCQLSCSGCSQRKVWRYSSSAVQCEQCDHARTTNERKKTILSSRAIESINLNVFSPSFPWHTLPFPPWRYGLVGEAINLLSVCLSVCLSVLSVCRKALAWEHEVLSVSCSCHNK